MPKIVPTAAAVAACAALTAATALAASADGGSATAAAATPSRLDAAVRAVRTAEDRISRGEAYDIESDRLRGKRVWEVKVAGGGARPHEIDVRADGRKVVRTRHRRTADDDARKAARAHISLARALRTAGRRAGGGTTFDEAEIDRVRGRIVWEATFDGPGDREVEVRVDAHTGKVLAVTRDD
jgi:uncharacterized membrane protein YkoI